jgi:hypothetical protein
MGLFSRRARESVWRLLRLTLEDERRLLPNDINRRRGTFRHFGPTITSAKCRRLMLARRSLSDSIGGNPLRVGVVNLRPDTGESSMLVPLA